MFNWARPSVMAAIAWGSRPAPQLGPAGGGGGNETLDWPSVSSGMNLRVTRNAAILGYLESTSKKYKGPQT
jgi:hypothetical protein